MQQLAIHAVLPIIRQQIRDLAINLGTNIINKDEITRDAITGREFAGSFRWPIIDALKFFESDGALKINKDSFEIINGDYFSVDLKVLHIPISYSIDKRIEKNLTIMTGLYGQLFDLENRLRFFLTKKLQKKYGEDFLQILSRSIRESISSEKRKLRIFIPDTRISELEFSQFIDLKNILKQEVDFIPNDNQRTSLLEKMDHLTEVRNTVSHNNVLTPEEVVRTKDNCLVIKNILEVNE